MGTRFLVAGALLMAGALWPGGGGAGLVAACMFASENIVRWRGVDGRFSRTA
jgi:hypothetical protein